MKKYLANFLKFTIFLGIGLTILYLVYQRQDAAYQQECLMTNIPEAECSLIQKIIDDFRSANFFWIAMVLLAYIISNISRAIRWQMLLKPLGFRPRFLNSFFTIIVGYFANLGLPRIGEVIRAASFSKYERVPVEKAMGTIVVDRTVDLISLLTAVGVVFLFEYDTLWSYLSEMMTQGDQEDSSLLQNNWVRGFIFIVLMIGVGLFIFRKRLKESAFFKKAIHILRGFREGVLSIRKLDRPWWFVFHSINIWFMYYLMTYLCFFAFEPTSGLSPLAGLMVFVFGAFGIVIPSPGGMGTFHFLAIQALSMYGISGGDAFSFANILFFSVQLGCNVLVGIIAMLLLPVINRNYKPSHAAAV